MKDSRLTYEQFAAIVATRPGLSARNCGNDHWQITGGTFLVNVWPRTKQGFRFHVAGMAGSKIGKPGPSDSCR